MTRRLWLQAVPSVRNRESISVADSELGTLPWAWGSPSSISVKWHFFVNNDIGISHFKLRSGKYGYIAHPTKSFKMQSICFNISQDLFIKDRVIMAAWLVWQLCGGNFISLYNPRASFSSHYTPALPCSQLWSPFYMKASARPLCRICPV